MMETEQIKELMEQFARTGLRSLRLSQGDFTLASRLPPQRPRLRCSRRQRLPHRRKKSRALPSQHRW